MFFWKGQDKIKIKIGQHKECQTRMIQSFHDYRRLQYYNSSQCTTTTNEAPELRYMYS